jgi:tRNA pseudouridine55 synthase
MKKTKQKTGQAIGNVGEALGTGAHLTLLRRIQTGGFGVDRCVTLAQLEAWSEDQRLRSLQPVDALLRSLPSATLEGKAAERFRHGNPVDLPAGLSGKVRIYVDGTLIGVGEPAPDGRLWPRRLVQLTF